MYARTSTIQADRSKVEDGITLVRDQIFPTVTAIDGCIGMSLLVDRESGRCIATTGWRTEDAMAASAEQVRPLRDDAQQAMGATSSTVDTWEVAVMHRHHDTPDGAWARVTWLSGEGLVDRALDTYGSMVLPTIQEWDGFCSASLMTDRDSGRVVGTVTFETQAQLEATRTMAMELRQRASGMMDAMVDDVAEMEVAFAHLHVPELV